MLKVYIAGASADIERVERFMEGVRNLGGVAITYDWTKAVRLHGSQGDELTAAQRRAYADADRRGIRAAEIVVILVSPYKSEGCAWELGYAQALVDMVDALGGLLEVLGHAYPVGDKTIIFSGAQEHVHRLLFNQLVRPHPVASSDEDTLAFLAAEA